MPSGRAGRRMDGVQLGLSRDAALRAASFSASGATAQPRHVRADVSRAASSAWRHQRRVSDREPLRARGGAPGRPVRDIPHAGPAASRPDLLRRLLPSRSITGRASGRRESDKPARQQPCVSRHRRIVSAGKAPRPAGDHGRHEPV